MHTACMCRLHKKEKSVAEHHVLPSSLPIIICRITTSPLIVSSELLQCSHSSIIICSKSNKSLYLSIFLCRLGLLCIMIYEMSLLFDILVWLFPGFVGKKSNKKITSI